MTRRDGVFTLTRSALSAVGLALLLTGSLCAQGPVRGAGFSAPARPAEVVPADRIISVRLEGFPETSPELIASLKSRVGQAPSRVNVTDDIEMLFASQQFSRIEPRWERSTAGWILTYVVQQSAAPLIVRGQTPEEEPAAAGHSRPSPAKFQPLRRDADEPGETPAPANAFTLEEPLADVRIEGNVTISTSDIARHVKVRPGRTVTQAMIKDDVDEMIRTRWFASVEPLIRKTDDGLVLVYKVLERPIVRRVEYRGADKIKVAKLESLTNLKVGSPYDVSANRECARRIEEMYHEKGFAFATVELEKGNDKQDREVVFVIHEGSKVFVSGVDFEGNKFFSDAVLDLKLRTKTRLFWVIGGKYDPATIPDDIAAVQQYYHSLGFFDVGIQHELKFNDDRSRVRVVYTIDEGVRYKIGRVDMMGPDVIPEADLRKDHTIETGEYFTQRKLSADVEKMREKYGKLGRLFAKIDAVPRFTETPGTVDILYRVDEDKVYRVREFNVHIAGDHPHTRTNLVRNISTIQPGDLADPKKIQQAKARIAGAGYFENSPGNEPRLDIRPVKEPGWLTVPETELARAQNVGGFTSPAPITTARPTSPPPAVPQPRTSPPPMPRPPKETSSEPQAARRPLTAPVIQTASGYQDNEDAFAPLVMVDEGGDDPLLPIVRGQGGGDPVLAQGRGPMPGPQGYIFDDSPQGNPLRPAIRDPDPNMWEQMPPPEFIDIDAYLAEARTGRLMFGVGVNSNAGVIGNIVLQENNFDIMRPPTSWADVWNGTAWRGAGQKFRIEAMPGTQVSRYLVDWQDPYFLDSNVNFGVSGFYYQRYFRYWNEQRLGGRLRTGYQLTQQWSTSLALRLEGVQLSGAPAAPPPLLAASLGDNFLSTVRFGLAHDTRDSAFLPSTGHFVEFSVEQAFAEYDYTRLELEGRQFYTTYARPDGFGKHILALYGQLGWTGDNTPIYERFYAGGFQSFRGFAFRGVTPRDGVVEIGGQFQALGSVEYMLPVTANEMIKTVVFTDFGTVDNSATFNNFRLSAGAGLRITVPGMGPVPIALDWAFPIMKQDFDRDQLFSFYIGINR